MKIAIHQAEGSFSDRWIRYCHENKIPYKIVDCYSHDILDILQDCSGLMWHWSHDDYRAQNFARQLVLSLEKRGIKVFPDSNTCWHFDDKIGQKYLLEAVGAPLVKTYVFYDKEKAYEWISSTTFPKVFKLRGGAGSLNVRLVKTKSSAKKLIHQAFNKGFPLVDKLEGLKQRIWLIRKNKNATSILHFMKGIARTVFPVYGRNLLPQQKGYVYFQDFIPGNAFDDRVVIIGNRAIAIRRFNRKDDFRASGSGLISHDPNQFKTEVIRTAFEVSDRIGSQSTAFDFVYNESGEPKIVEISYGYAMGPAYDNCPGYWDKELKWHSCNVNPQYFIIEDFLNSLK